MNAPQKREVQAYRRVEEWIGARPELTAPASTPAAAPTASGPATPATPPASASSISSTQAAAVVEQLTVLSGVVQEVTALAAQQDQQGKASLAATAEARRLRSELLAEHMRPIASIARAAIPDVVKMTVELRAPSAQIDAEALFASAEAMATAGEKYAATLILRGLPQDFAAQLRSVAEAYKQEIDLRGKARGSSTGATTGIHAEFGIGRKAVSSISVIVTKVFRQQPAVLAEWEQIKRVTIKGVKAVAPSAPATGAAATPAAQQAA